MINEINPIFGFLRMTIARGIEKAITVSNAGMASPYIVVAHPMMVAITSPIISNMLLFIAGLKEIISFIKIG
jgi:hypothetical protein